MEPKNEREKILASLRIWILNNQLTKPILENVKVAFEFEPIEIADVEIKTSLNTIYIYCGRKSPNHKIKSFRKNPVMNQMGFQDCLGIICNAFDLEFNWGWLNYEQKR